MGGDWRRNASKSLLLVPHFWDTTKPESDVKLGPTCTTAVDIDFKLCFRAALVF